VGARYSAPAQTGPGAHQASCTMGTGSFLEVKSGRSVTLTPHPLLVPRSRNSRAITLPPYGPYGLYRASVPVQGCTLPYLTTVTQLQVNKFNQTRPDNGSSDLQLPTSRNTKKDSTGKSHKRQSMASRQAGTDF
jgi:hypothetical protein